MFLTNDYIPSHEADVALSIFGSSGVAIGPFHALTLRHTDNGSFAQAATMDGVDHAVIGKAEFPTQVDRFPISAPGTDTVDFEVYLCRVSTEFPRWGRLDPGPVAFGTPIVIGGAGHYANSFPCFAGDTGFTDPRLHYGTNTTEDPTSWPAGGGDPDAQVYNIYWALNDPASGAPNTESMCATNDSGSPVFSGPGRVCALVNDGADVAGGPGTVLCDYFENFDQITHPGDFESGALRLGLAIDWLMDNMFPGARSCRSLVYQSRADRSFAGTAAPETSGTSTSSGAYSSAQLSAPHQFRQRHLRFSH